MTLRGAEHSDVVANTHSEQGLVELASGIDALYLSGRGELLTETLERFKERRECAEELNLTAPVDVGPLTFSIAPHGWGMYRYCLDHPLGRVGATPSAHLPAIRVQPRSEFIHAVGPTQAVTTFENLLPPLCSELSFGASRIDIYVDVEGFPLRADDRERYVCRADARRTYEQSERCSGFDFGSRRAGTLTGRIYDKTLDITGKGSDWWFDVWGDRHTPGVDVTRVEIEFGRKALTEFHLDSPAQVIPAVGGLWAYATDQWLTHRIPTSDSNRSRWPLSPQWQVVQNATLRHDNVELERLQARGRAGSLRKLTPGLVGYLAGFAALVGTEDIPGTVEALARHISDDEIARRTTFAERVRRRRIDGMIA
jgi:hypothetical protein